MYADYIVSRMTCWAIKGEAATLARPRRGQRVTYHCKCKKKDVCWLRCALVSEVVFLATAKAIMAGTARMEHLSHRVQQVYKPNKSKEKHVFLQHLHSLKLHQVLVQLLSPLQHLGSLLRVSPMIHSCLVLLQLSAQQQQSNLIHVH